MAQQNIDFGTFPNDPSADPIRAAFQKVQTNFTDLYSQLLSTGVSEITAGSGLTQNRTTGNVQLTASISSITIKTSGFTGSTNSLRVGVSTTPTASTATVSTYSLPFTIDLAPNITTVNANFTGSLYTANFGLSGFVNTSLIPSGNKVYDLGSPTHRWHDLYLSGQSINLNNLVLSSPDGTSLAVPAVTVSGSIDAGTVSAGSVSGSLTTAVQPNITSVGTLNSLVVAGAIQAANMSITGAFSAGTIYGNVVLPPGATIQAPGSDTQLIFNDSGVQQAVAGMTFNKASSLLTVQGNISGANVNSGNATFTGNIGVNKVVATGNIEASNLVTLGILSTTTGITTGANLAITGISGSGTQVTISFDTQTTVPFVNGSTITIVGVSPDSYNGTWSVVTGTSSSVVFNSTLTASASYVGATIKGNGNTTINGILQVVGNTSFGNITSVNTITGQTIVLSGDATSANLTATGVLRVTGTANLGAVFSPGDANVANSIVRGNFTTSGSRALFAGALVGNSTATFNGLLTANANASIVGYINASGNLTAGNISTAGTFNSFSLSAVGNINGGNISTSGTFNSASVSASGLVYGANLSTAGQVNSQHLFATGNISAGGQFYVSSFANVGSYMIVGGNLTTNGAWANMGGHANVGGNVYASHTSLTGSLTATHANVSGSLNATLGANIANFIVNSTGSVNGNIFTAQMFMGNGANITFVNGANVTGIVANASYSTNANYSGFSNSATYSNAANFAGSSTFAGTANGIATGSYSNITGVGTLVSLNITGDFGSSTGNITAGGYVRMSVNNAVAAAGAVQSTATVLTKTINVITGGSGGVQLPSASAGQIIYIINDMNATITVYPASGQYIDAQAQNAGFTVGPYGRMQFIGTSGTKYYSMTSIYA